MSLSRKRRVVTMVLVIKLVTCSIVISLVMVERLLSTYWFEPTAMADRVAARLKEDAAKKQLPDLDSKNSEGLTGLMLAVERNNPDMLSVLLKYGANPDIVDEKGGNTALAMAFYHGDYNTLIKSDEPSREGTGIVQQLLAAGANPNIANKQGETPILLTPWITDYSRREALTKVLVENGAALNAQDKNGNTIVHLFVEKLDNGWINRLKELFPSIINFNLANKRGLTPAGLAQSLFYNDMLDPVSGSLTPANLPKPLGSDGAINATDAQKRTPLMLSILRGDLNFAQNMLAKGADPNAQDTQGTTALHEAILMPNASAAVTLLLTNQANPNLANKKGQTPMHLVTRIADAQTRLALAQQLLKAGCNIYLQDVNGETVIHYAVRKNDTQLVGLLVGQIGNILKNKDGLTARDLAETLGRSQLFGRKT